MPAESDFYDALGRTIQVIRTDLGLSRRELADRVGISYSYMAAIETGRKRPSSPVLLTIARRLGLQSHELLEAAERRIGGRSDLRPSDGTTSTAELARLAGELSAGDLQLLVAMARRLAGSPSTRRD